MGGGDYLSGTWMGIMENTSIPLTMLILMFPTVYSMPGEWISSRGISHYHLHLVLRSLPSWVNTYWKFLLRASALPFLSAWILAWVVIVQCFLDVAILRNYRLVSWFCTPGILAGRYRDVTILAIACPFQLFLSGSLINTGGFIICPCSSFLLTSRWKCSFPGMILGLCVANGRRHYFVTTSLIGWAQT